VLQIIPALDAGGAERTTIEVAGALAREGLAALVASQGGRLEPDLAKAGGALIRLPVAAKNPVAILANAFKLARIVRARNVKLIHARSRAPAWSAFMAARMTGVPFVATYHGIYNARSALKRLYNSVMARADAVIANSEWTAAHIQDEYGFAPKRLAVIPRGVDLALFDPGGVAPERVATLRASWKAADGMRIVLLPGRLTRWKGQHVFVEALSQLAERGALAGVCAVIAGDPQGRDDYAAGLADAIVENALADVAMIAGHVADMPAAYLAADIVVSASTDPEAFGRVAAEAQAMGRAVIATDHGGARETVLPDVSGLLIPPGDAAALAGALGTLLARDADALAAMGAAGRRHIATGYTVERMCADTLLLYRALIGV